MAHVKMLQTYLQKIRVMGKFLATHTTSVRMFYLEISVSIVTEIHYLLLTIVNAREDAFILRHSSSEISNEVEHENKLLKHFE